MHNLGPNHIILLIKRLGISLGIYTLCRLILLLFNYSFFDNPEFSLFFFALKFDLAAIFYSNVAFIILHLIPFNFRYSSKYQKLLKYLFHFVNSAAVILNCIDIEYIKYTGKRSTSDIFDFINLGDDLKSLAPQFMKDFWYIVIIVILLVILSEYLYRKTRINFKEEDYPPPPLKELINSKTKPELSIKLQTLLGIAFLGISVMFMRGGFQLKPLGINSASIYASNKNTALLLNTPFTIIRTLGSEYLNEYTFYDNTELLQRFNPVKQYYHTNGDATKPNVVLIIMESFSKEYIGSLSGKKTYTPFLDSLANYSLICTNAYANGKKSIEGLPAIISGIPTLMNTPYSTSVYTGNSITSLPGKMKEMGYSTSFFHGGANGTMGFDSYCKLAGFESYYGKNEYPEKIDFDGNWGIFDEPFFKYFASKLNQSEKPFFGCFFSLSSHHPYTIPEIYKERFGSETNLPTSISYADFALQKFFEAVRKTEWFNNTIFIITADHTGISEDPFYSNHLGMYQVPLLFYKPDGSLKGKLENVAQQIDILPSVLDILGYNKVFYSIGESVFNNEKERFSISYINGQYQLVTDRYLLKTTLDEQLSLYGYKTDSLLMKNLTNDRKNISDSLNDLCKAIIQTYNHSLINNKLVAE